MTWQDSALISAGVVGAATALVHGALTQKFMVRPIEGLSGPGMTGVVRRLVPPLLQFSTFNWFVGGVALVIAATLLGREARLAVGLIVGSSYLFGAIGNAWATHGRHPGWMLMAVAVALIGVGLGRPAA